MAILFITFSIPINESFLALRARQVRGEQRKKHKPRLEDAATTITQRSPPKLQNALLKAGAASRSQPGRPDFCPANSARDPPPPPAPAALPAPTSSPCRLSRRLLPFAPLRLPLLLRRRQVPPGRGVASGCLAEPPVAAPAPRCAKPSRAAPCCAERGRSVPEGAEKSQAAPGKAVACRGEPRGGGAGPRACSRRRCRAPLRPRRAAGRSPTFPLPSAGERGLDVRARLLPPSPLAQQQSNSGVRGEPVPPPRSSQTAAPAGGPGGQRAALGAGGLPARRRGGRGGRGELRPPPTGAAPASFGNFFASRHGQGGRRCRLAAAASGARPARRPLARPARGGPGPALRR